MRALKHRVLRQIMLKIVAGMARSYRWRRRSVAAAIIVSNIAANEREYSALLLIMSNQMVPVGMQPHFPPQILSRGWSRVAAVQADCQPKYPGVAG